MRRFITALRLPMALAAAVITSPIAIIIAMNVDVQVIPFWLLLTLLLVAQGLFYSFTLTVVQRYAEAGVHGVLGSTRATLSERDWSTSEMEALAMKGHMDKAVAAFDALLARKPNDRELLREAIEFHATRGDAERAARLLTQYRSMPNCTTSEELYATRRLIDLYEGRLARDDRALVELRRLAERFPDTPDGAGARAALAERRKLRMSGGGQ